MTDPIRAALSADGPAVPEGREPASVVSEPSDKELLEEGPSLEEVEELCEEHCFNVEGYESIECLQGLINDALARWGTPNQAEIGSSLGAASATAPVPVSERWPGPEDCTAEGRYWIWTKAGAIWRWQLVYLQFIDLRHGEQTHWLPAHALPLPAGEVEP